MTQALVMPIIFREVGSGRGRDVNTGWERTWAARSGWGCGGARRRLPASRLRPAALLGAPGAGVGALCSALVSAERGWKRQVWGGGRENIAVQQK